MRVNTLFAQDEQIVDIDNTDADPFISKDRSGCNDFECHFDTATDEHDVGVVTIIGRESGPNGSSGDAVSLGLRVSQSICMANQTLPLQA